LEATGLRMNWQDITNEREKYAAYLCSREWAEKREAVRERAHGKCERCFLAPIDACHHLNYERKYCERLDDLQAICRACHDYIHGKSSVDPRTFTKPLDVCTFPDEFVSVVMCPRCATSMVRSIVDAEVCRSEQGIAVITTCQCSCCQITFKLQLMIDKWNHLTICYLDCGKANEQRSSLDSVSD
jgi:hypothetical protein